MIYRKKCLLETMKMRTALAKLNQDEQTIRAKSVEKDSSSKTKEGKRP